MASWSRGERGDHFNSIDSSNAVDVSLGAISNYSYLQDVEEVALNC